MRDDTTKPPHILWFFLLIAAEFGYIGFAIYARIRGWI